MKSAVFLDFQGTIGGSGVGGVDSLALYPFSARAIKRLNDAGFLVVGITNQKHISDGSLTRLGYDRALSRIEAELAAEGARFDAVYHCPHNDGDGCNCRKPKTGMVDAAVQRFDIDLKNSYVVGDMTRTDMRLCRAVGARSVLVLTGAGRASLERDGDADVDYVAENLQAAADGIISAWQ